MEGLGVAASIVGLLAAGAKLGPWLFEVASDIADAPDSVKSVLAELNEMDIILKETQIYILQEEPDARMTNRRSLILLEQISVTLTGFVVTYSDLESHLDFVKDPEEMSLFDRSRWVLKEKEILDVVRRLQNHKSSLATMLNILHCHSMQEAKESVRKLSNLIEQSLSQDSHLRTQLERRKHLQHQNTPTIPNVHSIVPDTIKEDASTITSARSRISRLSVSSFRSLGVNIRRSLAFPFEKELQSSRVYKRAGYFVESKSQLSLDLISRQGSERGMALSAFSKYSLAEISNLSVFSLPVLAMDLYNSTHFEFSAEPTQQVPSIPLEYRIARPDLDPQTSTTREVLLDYHDLPEIPQDIFVGREFILSDMLSHLVLPGITSRSPRPRSLVEGFRGSIEVPLFVLWGGPGTGKTRVALEFVRRYRSAPLPDLRTTTSKQRNQLQRMSYATLTGRESLAKVIKSDRFNYILWADASTKDTLAASFLAFARQMKIPKIADATSFYTKFQKNFIEHIQKLELPWLLILDNLNDENIDFLQAFNDYRRPSRFPGAILITTRDPDISSKIQWLTHPPGRRSSSAPTLGAGEAELRGLTDGSATTLLRSHLPTDSVFLSSLSSIISNIFKMIGTTPLAILALAAVLVEHSYAFQESLSSLTNNRYLLQLLYETPASKCYPGASPGWTWMSTSVPRHLATLTHVFDEELARLAFSSGKEKRTRKIELLGLIVIFKNQRIVRILHLQTSDTLYTPYKELLPNSLDVSDYNTLGRVIGRLHTIIDPDHNIDPLFRAYISMNYMTEETRQMAFDLAASILLEAFPTPNLRRLVNSRPQSVATPLLSLSEYLEQVANLTYFLTNYILTGSVIPEGTGFSVNFLTVIRKLMCPIIDNNEPVPKELSPILKTVEDIINSINTKNLEGKIYGNRKTVYFELATLHALYGALQRRHTPLGRDSLRILQRHFKEAASYYDHRDRSDNDEILAPKPLSQYFTNTHGIDSSITGPHSHALRARVNLARCLISSNLHFEARVELVEYFKILEPKYETVTKDPRGRLGKEITREVVSETYALGLYTLASIHFRRDDYESALRSLEAAAPYFAICFKDGHIYNTGFATLMGLALLEVGMSQKAITHLNKAHEGYESLMEQYESSGDSHNPTLKILPKAELSKRIARIEYMLHLAHTDLNHTEEGDFWLRCAEATQAKTTYDLPFPAMENLDIVFGDPTDFGLSDPFSPEWLPNDIEPWKVETDYDTKLTYIWHGLIDSDSETEIIDLDLAESKPRIIPYEIEDETWSQTPTPTQIPTRPESAEYRYHLPTKHRRRNLAVIARENVAAVNLYESPPMDEPSETPRFLPVPPMRTMQPLPPIPPVTENEFDAFDFWGT
ncbi:hypothetical protein H072_6387 [Dactylellina haptotyla CBS 200.50]|uniref:Uncharacterized protein n=1 Tax=Dactylellina haptotyla (strain CBS 200.50) TaxID=1284197 RepID=S8AA85_DACHA|nr:hypothetical protein H072_6387 [Dactylellina haptotyla CBS 200.50]